MIDAEEDLAMLFGDEDFSDEDWGDDDDEEEDSEVAGEVLEAWLMAPITPPPMMSVPPPTTYKVRGPSTTTEGHSSALMTHGVAVPPSVIDELSTRMDNLEYGHGSLVKKVMTVSNAEVTDSIAIWGDLPEGLCYGGSGTGDGISDGAGG
ncbi:hypothetical protein Tco_0723981 [Tanacetum coccineum]